MIGHDTQIATPRGYLSAQFLQIGMTAALRSNDPAKKDYFGDVLQVSTRKGPAICVKTDYSIITAAPGYTLNVRRKSDKIIEGYEKLWDMYTRWNANSIGSRRYLFSLPTNLLRETESSAISSINYRPISENNDFLCFSNGFVPTRYLDYYDVSLDKQCSEHVIVRDIFYLPETILYDFGVDVCIGKEIN